MTNSHSKLSAPMKNESDHVKPAPAAKHAQLDSPTTAPAGLVSNVMKSKARGSKVAGH